MRTKSFILTFLMMMFCSISFGQNTNPDWGEFNYHDYAMNMEVIAKISLDGEAQTSTSIQVAAYCGNERRSEVVNVKSTPGGSLVQLQVFGVKGFPTDPNQTQTTEKITFKFYDGTSMFVSYEDMDFKGNHVVGDLFNPFTIEFKSVAKIGDVKYGSLDAAINAAQANDVIVLLADVVAETNPVNIPANVTLDLNAHTIKADIFGTVRTNNGLWITSDDYKMIGKDADIYASNDATVVNTLVNNVNTITIAAGNVTLAATQYNEWWTAQGQELIIGENAKFTIPQGKKFNIESNTSVTINGTVSNEGTLAIKENATVKGNITGDIHFLGGKYITADNYNMVGTTSDYYYNTTDALVNIAGQFGDITIKSGEMTLGQSWRTVQGQTLTIASGAKFTVPANMTFEVFQNTHVIVNGTLVTDGTVYLQLNATVKAAEGLNVTTNVADHKVVYEGGVYKVVAKVYIAQTETGAKFETLQEAVNAGTTVTLLQPATGAGVVIDKNITIDFATYTYTVNKAVGSTGTETLGFQILKNNTVTLMNGTLTSTAVTSGKEVKMLVQNYANLTLTDMNLDDATEHIQYVLSNNSGTSNINGATSITTDKVAFDVYDYTAGGYAVPEVNVNTTGIIDGKIEVSESISNNLNIKDGSFTNPIAEAWCAVGYIPTTEVVGETTYYTVKVGEYVAQVNDGAKYESLVEAYDAAQSGATVKLLKDATGAGLKINKDITVDFGGKTYTINQAVGSSGTESQGFQLLKEATEVTLQNGTVKVQDGAHVVWMINDYSAKLNVTNVIFNCEHMDLPNNGDASNVYFLVANNAHNQNPAVTLTDVEVNNFGSDFGSPYFMEPNTTIKSADANLDIEVDPGYRLVYDATQQTYSVEKLIAHFDGGAYARFAANKPREHFSITLQDVYASESLVVKVYHDETLLLTTTYRAEDLDASGVNRYPVSAERLTVNNVVSGKVAGSWLNEYMFENVYSGNKHFAVNNVPNKFKVYVDGILTDTYDGTQNPNAGFSSAENLKTYLGFDGVYKAASVTRGTDVTYYMTLAEAWNATQDGDIVTLYDNVELTARLNVANNITLNLNNKNITANFEDSYGAIYVKKGAELTLEGEGGITSNNSVAIGTYGTVNIKGGNITSGEGYAALYVFYYPNHSEGTANISGGRLNVVWNCGILNVSGGQIDYLDTSSELDVTDGVITKMLAKDGSDASGAYEMNIQNIETTVPTVEVQEHFKFVEIRENVYQVVAKNYVAQTETGAKFETLKEAIDAANETVTLLQTATGAGVVINKNITIDFGGYTYSFNEGVGSGALTSNGFQLLQGNTVVLKNGELNVNAEDADEFYILVQNYTNLTVENMTLDGTNLDKWSKVQDNWDSYVLSNNSGTVNITGATNITANNDGDKAFAFDVCKYGSYAPPVVNVNTTGTIAGKIEVSSEIPTNLNISGGTFTVEIEEAWCADGYIPTQTEDGKWTVKLGEYVARVNGQGYETFDAALAADGEVIVIKPIVITEDKEYNFTNEKITGDNVYPIFRIQNGATMIVTGGEVTNPTDYVFVLGASDGSSHGDLIINGGKYHGATTVASVTLGALTITGGEFSVEPYEGNYAFLINCIDANYKNGTASVAITGGTFHNWNPQNNAAEGTGTDFCYVDHAATETAENVWTVLPAVAKIGEARFATLQDAVNAAQANETINLIANVQLTKFVTIDKSVNLNLGQFDITRNDGTALYVNGENIQVAIYGTGKVSGYQAVFVNNGIVTINGGNFVGNPEAVYVINNGHAVINGGRFETIDSDKRYVLNEYDATRDVTTINVYGGTFVGFDPENNAAEGAGTNFCAEGYISDDNGDGTFTVRRGEYVAQIAETGAKYETLQAAYEAANANHTIVLLQNVTLDATFAIAKGVTLNGSENNYKLTVNANGIPAVKVNTNDDVIFKNLVIESTGYNNGSQTHGVHIAKKANVTFDNVDVNSVYSVFVESSAAESVINVNNGSKLYADMSGIYAKGKVTINVTNSWVEKYYNGGSAIYVNGEYSVVNVVNSTIKATSTSNAHFAAFEIGADNVTVNVDENSKIEVINSSYDIYAFYVGDKELNNRVLTNHNIIIADGATINKNKETDPVIYIKDAEVKVTKDNVATMMYFRLIDALAVSHVEGETMTILKPVVLTENAALNIEGRTIITAENVYPAIRVQNDAEVTITGEGTIKNDDYVFVVGASDASSAGNLTIENGTYVGETTVAQVTLGKLNITGGDFSITDVETYDYAYLINCKDEYYNAGTAQVEIKGGTFHNFNPQNNAAEGAGTNFCAEGYGAYESAPNVWTVRGAVARIGDRYFAKVADATSAAVTGDIVYLLDNVNDAEVTVDLNTAKKITIDLGDFTYTSTGTAFIAYRNGTELTITNGTVNGNGAAGGTLRATYNATLILGADLTVNAGPQATAIVIQDGKFFVNPNTENVIVNGGIDCIKVQENVLEVSIASGTYTEDVQEWCAQGYVSQNNGNGTWTVRAADYVAEIEGGAKFTSLQGAIDAAQNNNTVTVIKSHELAETVIVNKDVEFKFENGVQVTAPAYSYENGVHTNPTAFRIVDGATVTVNSFNITSGVNGLYNFILGAADGETAGNLVINDGTFVANTSVVSVTKGNLVIEGGDFSLVEGTTDYRYLINCIDANYNNGTATVAISGGTFHNWNPQDNAAETGGHANFCAEGYAAVETSTGVWEVVPMQEMKLYAGWNWFSSYIDINGEAGLGRLQDALNPHGVQIKNDGGFTQYTEGQGWFGPNLTSASVKEMYMINMSADHNLQLKGELVDLAQNAITLEHGWNWIGYQLNIGLNLENALAGFNPNHGDRIKSHQGFSQYYKNESYTGWWGTLETMTPGYGYMYYNANEDDATLEYSYPADGSKSEVRANITSENNYWVPASSRYAGNMNIVAMLEADGDNYEIAAFVGGEVRGSARPIYVEPLDAYMFFLTIHGDEVEEMSFRVYDLATGEEYNLNDRMNYTDNAIVGSITEPYIFRGTVGVGETSLGEINVYPNPTTIGNEINLGTECDTVEVFNALGVKVAEYQNVDTVDALETAGIYVIRITNNGNVQNCRLIVK